MDFKNPPQETDYLQEVFLIFCGHAQLSPPPPPPMLARSKTCQRLQD